MRSGNITEYPDIVNANFFLRMASPNKQHYRSYVQAANHDPYLDFIVRRPLLAVLMMTAATQKFRWIDMKRVEVCGRRKLIRMDTLTKCMTLTKEAAVHFLVSSLFLIQDHSTMLTTCLFLLKVL